MSLPLPDKWVRKAIFDALNGLVVDSLTINTYDSHTGVDSPNAYILMTTQTNNETGFSKCGSKYLSSILLDIVTRYEGAGNPGSRLLCDNIADSVRGLCDNLTLDVSSGVKIQTQTVSFPNDITTKTNMENVFRKLIRYEFLISNI